MAEKVQIDFIANADDLISDALRIQLNMDKLDKKLKDLGISQTAYNKAVANTKKAHEQSTTAAMSLSTVMTGMYSATQLVAQGFQQIQKAYEFFKGGAEIQFMETKFARLAASIGTTAQFLMTDLRAATRGTISDMELMASVTDLVGLGLANSHDEAVRLATVSAGLGMNMNQLVLTMTNMTTMRFDALGVRVDGFKEKVKALEQAGYSADEAFREAFLRQAEDQLKLVGNAADEAIGSFKRLEAQSKTFWDQLRSDADASPIIEILADAVEEQNIYNRALSEGGPRLIANAKAIFNNGNAMISWNTAMEIAVQQWNEHQKALQANTENWVIMQDAMSGGVTAIESIEEAAKKAADAEKELAARTKAVSDENALFLSTLDKAGSALDTYEGGIASANQELAEGKITAEEHAAQVAELEAQYKASSNGIVLSILEMKLAADGWTDTELNAYLTVGTQMGVFTQKQKDAATQAIGLANSLVKGVPVLAIEEILLQRLGGRVEDATIGIMDLNPAIENMTEVFTDASGMVAATNVQLNGLPKSGATWTYTFNIIQNGRVPTVAFGKDSEERDVGLMEHQAGGPVYAGNPYMVGEAGPEPVIPAMNGRILGHAESLHAMTLGGGGGAKYGPFYGPVTLEISEEGAGGIMGIR